TSRVVPASSLTIARFEFASALSRLDLPTLGGPASAMRTPSRTSRPCSPAPRPARSSRMRSSRRWPTHGGSAALTSPSSEKSSRASISARRSSSVSRQSPILLASAPPARASACLRCASVSATIKSPSPSTAVRSSRPFSNARRVNSPASASRTPGSVVTARSRARTTAREPCTWSSAQSSPVKLCGEGNQATRPRSRTSPSCRSVLSVITRGCGKPPASSASRCPALGPESRTTATPAGRAPEDSATIVSPPRMPLRSGIHRFEELGVVLRLAELIEQELDGVDRSHRVEDAAEHIHLPERVGLDQQLFLASARFEDIDRREDALVGDFAVEHDFRVAGAFELFEDHFVHAATGVDQRSRNDRQRPAFLDVARRTKETLWPLQRIGVDTTGQDFAGRRNDSVIGPAETGNIVEQNDDVALVLDKALGLFDHHFGDLDVAGGGFVEGRSDDFAIDGPLHVGDFLGALVDQEHDEVARGVIGRDRLGDVLHHDRLADAGRR